MISEALEFETHTDILTLLENVRCQGSNHSSLRQALLALATICSSSSENQEYFRVAGGVEELKTTLTEGSCPFQVVPAALFCLACAVKQNVTSQKAALSKDLLIVIHGVLSHTESSDKLVEAASFLLACIVEGNGRGQLLAEETLCLQELLEMLKKCIAEDCADDNKWSAVVRAIGVSVNNPQNEHNQQICCSVLPHVLRFITIQPDHRSVHHVLSLTGLIVADNASNQERIRRCGGIETLIEFVKKQASAQRLPFPYNVMACAVSAVDACIAENDASGRQAGELGLVSLLLELLEDRGFDQSQRQILVLTLAHVIEYAKEQRSLVSQGRGYYLLVSYLTDTQDDELFKAIKYILSMCKTEDDVPTKNCVHDVYENDQEEYERLDAEDTEYSARHLSSFISESLNALTNQLQSIGNISETIGLMQQAGKLQQTNIGEPVKNTGVHQNREYFSGKRCPSDAVESGETLQKNALVNHNKEITQGQISENESNNHHLSSCLECCANLQDQHLGWHADGERSQNSNFHTYDDDPTVRSGNGYMHKYHNLMNDQNLTVKKPSVLKVGSKHAGWKEKEENVHAGRLNAKLNDIKGSKPHSLQESFVFSNSMEYGQTSYRQHSLRGSFATGPACRYISECPEENNLRYELNSRSDVVSGRQCVTHHHHTEGSQPTGRANLCHKNTSQDKTGHHSVTVLQKREHCNQCDDTHLHSSLQKRHCRQKVPPVAGSDIGDVLKNSPMMMNTNYYDPYDRESLQSEHEGPLLSPGGQFTCSLSSRDQPLSQNNCYKFSDSRPLLTSDLCLQNSTQNTKKISSTTKEAESSTNAETETPLTPVLQENQLPILEQFQKMMFSFFTSFLSRQTVPLKGDAYNIDSSTDTQKMNAHDSTNEVCEFDKDQLKDCDMESTGNIDSTNCNLHSDSHNKLEENRDLVTSLCPSAPKSASRFSSDILSICENDEQRESLEATNECNEIERNVLQAQGQPLLLANTSLATRPSSGCQDNDPKYENKKISADMPDTLVKYNNANVCQGDVDQEECKKYGAKDTSDPSKILIATWKDTEREGVFVKPSKPASVVSQRMTSSFHVKKGTPNIRHAAARMCSPWGSSLSHPPLPSPDLSEFDIHLKRIAQKNSQSFVDHEGTSSKMLDELLTSGISCACSSNIQEKPLTVQASRDVNAHGLIGKTQPAYSKALHATGDARCPGCRSGMEHNSRTYNIALETSSHTCPYHRTIRQLEREIIYVHRKKQKSVAGGDAKERKRRMKDFGPKMSPGRSDVYNFTSDEREISSSPTSGISVNNIPEGVAKRQCSEKQVDNETRRPRIPYTKQELSNLLEGVKRIGKRWQQIRWGYEFHPRRTAVDLKEKYKRLLAFKKTIAHDSRSKQPLSMCEIRRLKRGVKTYGYNWKAILNGYRFQPGRTVADLRSQWQALNKVT